MKMMVEDTNRDDLMRKNEYQRPVLRHSDLSNRLVPLK